MTRTAGDWPAWLHGQLSTIRDQGRWRSHREFDAWGPRGTLVDAEGTRREVISFASNDYLGLTTHPRVTAAAHEAIDRWGTGSGAARLVTGNRPIHQELELELADWKQTDRAVVLPTGFATNLAVLSTLGGAGVRIVSDELNHASIIDGARLARAEVAVFPHGDLHALEQRVTEAPGPVIVVTDTVFSMDGDALDVAAVAAICRRHGALLVLDEAHAVLGPDPTVDDLAGVEVVRVGTLSKTLGSLGGFAACSSTVADLLVNAARPAIFTTGLSPADAAAGLAAVQVLRGPEGKELTATLRDHIDRLAPGHPSPIVPVVIGDERRAVAAATALLEQGLLVPAIRPPTVASGTSRLRVTFSAAHTSAEVDRLVAALAALDLAATAPVTRPERLVVVIGTATDVGKTWVGGQVLTRLRAAGVSVAARKPAQSAEADDPGPSDAAVLAAATGEAVETVCPAHRWYTVAMAPPMAAEALGLDPPTTAELLQELQWPDHDGDRPVALGWVETVGGPRSPIGSDGDAVTVIGALAPDLVLLVADAGLGTINSVLLSLDAVAGTPAVTFLNRYDPADELHRRNLDWLRTPQRLEVFVDLEALADLCAGLSPTGLISC